MSKVHFIRTAVCRSDETGERVIILRAVKRDAYYHLEAPFGVRTFTDRANAISRRASATNPGWEFDGITAEELFGGDNA